MSYQRVVIAGNLGKDPEVRHSQGGQAIANMSVAVSERIKKGDEWVEATEWFRCVAFGKTAETAGQHLKKGRKVLLEGKLRQRTYEKKDGTTGYSTELLVDRLVFLSSKGDGDDAPSPRSDGGGKKSSPQSASDSSEDAFDDDLPF